MAQTASNSSECPMEHSRLTSALLYEPPAQQVLSPQSVHSSIKRSPAMPASCRLIAQSFLANYGRQPARSADISYKLSQPREGFVILKRRIFNPHLLKHSAQKSAAFHYNASSPDEMGRLLNLRSEYLLGIASSHLLRSSPSIRFNYSPIIFIKTRFWRFPSNSP